MATLSPGTKAPDFSLPTTPDQRVALSDFRGRPVILAFYPADWSPVCGDQLALYNELLDEFCKHDAQFLGISVDGVWCHLAFAKDRKYRFPLMADFEPKGQVARDYGVYRSKEGVSERALYLGPPHAPAVLLEYGDYECPFCRQAHLVVKEVMRRLRGQLGYVFRHFPLSNMHPNAELAAEAAEAAGAQGMFWEMHEALYANQALLGPGQIEVLARELRLDTGRFVREVNERVYRERVRRDFMSGVRSGVNGTPTFFINGARFDGSWDADTLTTALRASIRAERGPAQHWR